MSTHTVPTASCSTTMTCQGFSQPMRRMHGQPLPGYGVVRVRVWTPASSDGRRPSIRTEAGAALPDRILFEPGDEHPDLGELGLGARVGTAGNGPGELFRSRSQPFHEGSSDIPGRPEPHATFMVSGTDAEGHPLLPRRPGKPRPGQYLGRSSRIGGGLGLFRFDCRRIEDAAGERVQRRAHRWQNLRLDVDGVDFGFDLRAEFVRGALELVHEAANRAPNLRQFLGAEKDQRQEKQENHLAREAKIHIAIIMRDGRKRPLARQTRKPRSRSRPRRTGRRVQKDFYRPKL